MQQTTIGSEIIHQGVIPAGLSGDIPAAFNGRNGFLPGATGGELVCGVVHWPDSLSNDFLLEMQSTSMHSHPADCKTPFQVESSAHLRLVRLVMW